MKFFSLLPILFCLVHAAPKLRFAQKQLPAQLLTLPSNATSIRSNIEDSFSCEGRGYGYYADVENDCQLFHVCLPVTYASGRSQMFRWSFICPEETIFNQELFTCARADESIDCIESPRFYNLNRNFGDELSVDVHIDTNTEGHDQVNEEEDAQVVLEEVGQNLEENDNTQMMIINEEDNRQTTPLIEPIFNRRIMNL